MISNYAKCLIICVFIFILFFEDVFFFFDDCCSVLKALTIIIYRIYRCFFFNPIERIYLWSTTFQIYFMTFVMQQINRIKDKIITFHWFSKACLISIKKWFKKFFNNSFKLSKIKKGMYLIRRSQTLKNNWTT